uniref:hypothetical protein n=1 Tax=Pectobacterium carotovorum TaxID=554 RepID=UPI0016801215|nr:hypothetical protein [Pectobacterium carotovorum]
MALWRLGRYVFPAPAGINRWVSWFTVALTSVPRASGDKPRKLMETLFALVYSPR